MRRRTVHAVFATLALACAAAVLASGLRLRHALALNAQIDAAAHAVTGASPQPAPLDAPREVRLARALALAHSGAHDAAFKAYAGLVPPVGVPDEVGRRALFNLANMLLRQASGRSPDGLLPSAPPPDAGPLIEIAKQRLRDLLRADPGDWDARYNLERALRLAPEQEAAVPARNDGPVERRSVLLRGMEAGDLP